MHPEHKHHFKLFFVAIGLVVLLAALYVLYDRVYWSPERAFTRMGKKISGSDAFALQLTYQAQSGPLLQFNEFTGSTRQGEAVHMPYVELMRAISTRYLGGPTFPEFQSKFEISYESEGSKIFTEGEYRGVSKTYFVKYDVLPTFGAPESLFGRFKGKWYKKSATCVLDAAATGELKDFMKTQNFVSGPTRKKSPERGVRLYTAMLNKEAILAIFGKEDELETPGCKRSEQDKQDLARTISEQIGEVRVDLVVTGWAGNFVDVNYYYNQAIDNRSYEVSHLAKYWSFGSDELNGVRPEVPSGAEGFPKELRFLFFNLDLPGPEEEEEETIFTPGPPATQEDFNPFDGGASPPVYYSPGP